MTGRGLLLAAALAGCGVKAPPRPPEREAARAEPAPRGTTAAPAPPSPTPAPTPPR